MSLGGTSVARNNSGGFFWKSWENLTGQTIAKIEPFPHCLLAKASYRSAALALRKTLDSYRIAQSFKSYLKKTLEYYSHHPSMCCSPRLCRMWFIRLRSILKSNDESIVRIWCRRLRSEALNITCTCRSAFDQYQCWWRFTTLQQ